MAVTYTEGSGDGKRDDVPVVVPVAAPEPDAPAVIEAEIEPSEDAPAVEPKPKKAPRKLTAGKHKR